MSDCVRYRLTWNYRAADIGDGRIAFLPLPKGTPEWTIQQEAIMAEVRDLTGITETTLPTSPDSGTE